MPVFYQTAMLTLSSHHLHAKFFKKTITAICIIGFVIKIFSALLLQQTTLHLVLLQMPHTSVK